MNPRTFSQANDSAGSVRTQGDELPDDPRLLQAVQEYLDLLERGQHPHRQDFLRRYPDIAEPLACCLDGLELVHKTAPVGPASRAGPEVPLGSRHLPADPLGDFQIVREIGRGGMGIVYEAVQLSLGRRVALKVLPFAATFDAKQLQRFRNEAQAAAQLHHTNIVPVYAVGSERGVHFYAMQLIEGQSLAVVVRQLRQQSGRAVDDEGEGQGVAPPKAIEQDQPTATFPPLMPPVEEAPVPDTVSQLSLVLSTQHAKKNQEYFRSVARFIVQAAEALEHAHQFGIVHRDIKPANLLVDVHGRLWITDFGLAQFHADAGLTQTGDLLGTLRYMSPEQASGQRVLLDHRTDIYSLGATLYELVTLEPILPGQTRQELLHQIINEEPRLPRAVDRSVPVELETIILKAVSKSPADRYNSARELAEDLSRYLEDKPILAKRPSLIERMRKWSRRHPSIVAAGMVVLLLCVAGLLVNNRMIAEEKARTTKALEGEQQRAAEAEKRFQQALQAVNLLMQVCEDELADAPPHLQGVRKRMMEMALAYYQDFIEQQQGNAALQAELEDGRNRASRILDDFAARQGLFQQMLVDKPDVRKDLKLSDAQVKRIADLRAAWFLRKPPAPEEQQDSPEEGRRKFLEFTRKTEKELDEILSPSQRERLRQIALQAQGLLAFHEPRVRDALRLTAHQKQEIRKIEGSVFMHMLPRPHPRGQPDGPDMDEVQRDAMKRAEGLFSPEQAKTWREMRGDWFQGRLFDPPPGRPGPPHPQGPPGPPPRQRPPDSR
ncbi:MAG TPA: serine/threonine-protein kinase [Gemmataceae bacterium]|jgi:hypothetical protein